MNKTSVILIAAVAGIMLVGALAVTMTTGQAHGLVVHGTGGNAQNGVNGGNNGHAHDPCDNAGPAEHNPNCQ
jgi:hypothetical protein